MAIKPYRSSSLPNSSPPRPPSSRAGFLGRGPRPRHSLLPLVAASMLSRAGIALNDLRLPDRPGCASLPRAPFRAGGLALFRTHAAGGTLLVLGPVLSPERVGPERGRLRGAPAAWRACSDAVSSLPDSPRGHGLVYRRSHLARQSQADQLGGRLAGWSPGSLGLYRDGPDLDQPLQTETM